jgi:glycosyltransferase involved in cell wall biosynthesis
MLVYNHMKRRILYVITKANWGGAQKYVYDLATSLDPQTYDVAVAYGQSGILDEKLRAAGIRTIFIPSLQRDVNPLLDISSFIDLIKIFRQERPDIVHLNSSKIGGLGALAGRIVGVPNIIFTVHGWVFNEERPAISKAFIWLASWITVLFCHRVIVLGDGEKKQALEMPFVNADKVVKIRNGIGAIDFKSQTEAREVLTNKIVAGGGQIPTGETLWYGTISELHVNKGLPFLIEALAKLDHPFISVVIGEGEERERLQEKINRLGLAGKVFLLGQIDNAATYLKAFDIFTLTSIKEGLPYVLLEAGLAERPVIASNVGSISDIVEDKKTGLLVPPQNIESIKNALVSLSANQSLRLEYGQNARKKIETGFSKDQMLKETVQLYYYEPVR